MGYIDAHGRPELVAQPFIKKGTSKARVVDTSEVAEGQPQSADDQASKGDRAAKPKE